MKNEMTPIDIYAILTLLNSKYFDIQCDFYCLSEKVSNQHFYKIQCQKIDLC